jgi:AraC-like DNA-binding protein
MVDDFLLFPSRPALRFHCEGEAVRDLGPGEFLLVPAGRRHRFELAPGRGFSEHVNVHFLCESQSQLCLNPLKLFGSCVFKLPQAPRWRRRLKWLAALEARSARAAASASQALVSELLLELIATQPFKAPPLCDDERIRLALELAEARFLDGVSVPELALRAGLGEVQFRKLFKRQTGQSPKRHLESLRLRRACELLRSSSLKSGELSRLLGFKGEWHFCAAFRKGVGMTPSEYRRLSLS